MTKNEFIGFIYVFVVSGQKNVIEWKQWQVKDQPVLPQISLYQLQSVGCWPCCPSWQPCSYTLLRQYFSYLIAWFYCILPLEVLQMYLSSFFCNLRAVRSLLHSISFENFYQELSYCPFSVRRLFKIALFHASTLPFIESRISPSVHIRHLYSKHQNKNEKYKPDRCSDQHLFN